MTAEMEKLSKRRETDSHFAFQVRFEGFAHSYYSVAHGTD